MTEFIVLMAAVLLPAFLLPLGPAVRLLTLMRETERHDAVLFRFHAIQRDITRFLFERGVERNSLSREDCLVIRRLTAVLDDTIDNYNHRKAVMFDLRKFRAFLREYENAAGDLNLPELPQDPEIREFYRRFAVALLMAFAAYTPFIRSEILLKVCALFLKEKLANLARPREDARKLGISIGWRWQNLADA